MLVPSKEIYLWRPTKVQALPGDCSAKDIQRKNNNCKTVLLKFTKKLWFNILTLNILDSNPNHPNAKVWLKKFLKLLTVFPPPQSLSSSAGTGEGGSHWPCNTGCMERFFVLFGQLFGLVQVQNLSFKEKGSDPIRTLNSLFTTQHHNFLYEV